MVYYRSSISLCNSVDRDRVMAASGNSGDVPCVKSRPANQLQRSRRPPGPPNCLKIPSCDQSRSAAVDVFIFLAASCAVGFLLFPYVKFVAVNSFEILGVVFRAAKEEVARAPMVFAFLGFSLFLAVVAASLVLMYAGRKCGNPNCRGLRKAAEFDIQLETEESLRKSSAAAKDGVRRGLFELPRDHHRELEAELKKMAPPNGRAVLIFRARCGCSVGRLEVLGPKKQRKIKK